MTSEQASEILIRRGLDTRERALDAVLARVLIQCDSELERAAESRRYEGTDHVRLLLTLSYYGLPTIDEELAACARVLPPGHNTA